MSFVDASLFHKRVFQWKKPINRNAKPKMYHTRLLNAIAFNPYNNGRSLAFSILLCSR